MIDLPTALGLLGEVLTWLGVLPALVLLPLGYGLRWWSHRFERVDGVVAERGPERMLVRWFACDGTVRDRWLPADAEYAAGDDMDVWVHPTDPALARFEEPRNLGRVWRLLGIVALSTAIVGGALQLVALL